MSAFLFACVSYNGESGDISKQISCLLILLSASIHRLHFFVENRDIATIALSLIKKNTE